MRNDSSGPADLLVELRIYTMSTTKKTPQTRALRLTQGLRIRTPVKR